MDPWRLRAGSKLEHLFRCIRMDTDGCFQDYHADARVSVVLPSFPASRKDHFRLIHASWLQLDKVHGACTNAPTAILCTQRRLALKWWHLRRALSSSRYLLPTFHLWPESCGHQAYADNSNGAHRSKALLRPCMHAIATENPVGQILCRQLLRWPHFTFHRWVD